MVMFRHPFDNHNEISRCMGFEAGVRRLNLANSKVITVSTNEDAVEEIIRRLEGENPVTAIATVNDDMAANILNQLAVAGVQVPEQVSITGFDDTEFGQKTTPPLTTVSIDRLSMGTLGAKSILSRIADPGQAPIKLVVDSELVERGSVKTL